AAPFALYLTSLQLHLYPSSLLLYLDKSLGP
ncbi:hypothetical protein CDAR_212341, partial [Caerostris darwini]